MIHENICKTFQNWLKATLSTQTNCNSKGRSYAQHDTRKQEQNITETGCNPQCLPQIDFNSKRRSYTQHDTRKQNQNIPELAESQTLYLDKLQWKRTILYSS